MKLLSRGHGVSDIPTGGRLYTYDRRRVTAKAINLADWDLDGLLRGEAVVAYHGTTRSFTRFDAGKSRDDLVDKFYGSGIFLSPSRHVAEKYATANRNIGFAPSLVDDLKRVNPNAGHFLQVLVTKGKDGWDDFMGAQGFFNENPPPGEGQADMEGFEKFLGVDPNTVGDIAGYVIGSKTKPLGMDDDGALSLFNTSTGSPDWVYDNLDKVGLDSARYRPKVYTVRVRCSNPLVTASRSQARSAKSKGYDCVVYHGSQLVDNVPEVAVFDPGNVQVVGVEVV